MPIDFSSATEIKILTAAESLFAEHGLNNVSLRTLTAKAGVNLAAINYHYYDKEALYRKIITLRLREINAIRLSELNQAEARTAGAPVPLVEIVQIMARPLFFSSNDPSTYNSFSRRLLGRIFTDPLPFSSDVLTAELQPVITRFGQALRRHNPSLSPQDFLWRLSFIVGAMHHAIATMHVMNSLTHGLCQNDDAAGALRNFTSFAVNAIGAEIR